MSARAAILAVVALQAQAEGKRPLSVIDTVERSAIPYPAGTDPVVYSPDGARYLVTIAQGDLQRNGVHVRFITGGTASLQAAAPREVAVLFSAAYGEDPVTFDNRPRWLADNERVAFLWDDERGVHQVTTLDLRSGALQRRTHHETSVMQFAVSRDTQSLLYTAFASHDRSQSVQMARRGFVVQSAYAPPFLAGELDGWLNEFNVELFLAKGSPANPEKLIVPGGLGAGGTPILEFAPVGGEAVVALPVHPPVVWNRYQSRIYQSILAQARQEPINPDVYQLHVVDTRKSVLRPLWNALWAYESTVSWAGDGKSIVTGPTFLPPTDSSSDGLQGRAFARVALNDGRYRQLSKAEFDRERIAVARQPASIRLEMHEGLNHPPVLHAIDEASGTQTVLLDLDPELRNQFLLGEVRLLHWSDAQARKWTGRLYLPVGYSPLQPVPLVVQLKPFSRTGFSLSGSEDYPSTFVAQLLANRGMATLQMEEPDVGIGNASASPQEPQIMMAGILSAIDYLAQQGIVDRSRVALSGFSRSGWCVEYALTHADFPFAAALAADHINASYDQAMLWAWPDEYVLDIGAKPYGDGLAAWLRESPGFNADRVRTPLRLQVHMQVASALGHWEMFSRLKRLQKPVELYIVPEADKAAHNLQNPVQRLASREGATDWFAFWLQGREDPQPGKTAQYARWRKLSGLAAYRFASTSARHGN